MSEIDLSQARAYADETGKVVLTIEEFADVLADAREEGRLEPRPLNDAGLSTLREVRNRIFYHMTRNNPGLHDRELLSNLKEHLTTTIKILEEHAHQPPRQITEAR